METAFNSKMEMGMESSADRVKVTVTNSDSEFSKIDDNQWFIVFNSFPNCNLNGVELRVCNFSIEPMSMLFSDKLKISFSIIDNVEDAIRDAMKKWCNGIDYKSTQAPIKAELVLRDSNGLPISTLKKYSLSEVMPTSISFGCAFLNKSLIEVGFTAVIHNSNNSNCCEDCSKPLNVDCIEDAKVVVSLLDKVSEIKRVIDEHDSLWEGTFMDALNNYEAFLQKECTEMLRSIIKDSHI